MQLGEPLEDLHGESDGACSRQGPALGLPRVGQRPARDALAHDGDALRHGQHLQHPHEVPAGQRPQPLVRGGDQAGSAGAASSSTSTGRPSARRTAG